MRPESASSAFDVALRGFVLAFAVLAPLAASAQFFQEKPDWKETEAPPPPAFDIAKLMTFKVNGGQSVVYGVDPASISVTKTDSVVRYVVVATSASGVRNVMYEGLHCETGQMKTYARQFSGKWEQTTNPQWQSVFGNMPSTHALAFAKAGACDNSAPGGTAAEIAARVKDFGLYRDY
jgi:hypothetical protein